MLCAKYCADKSRVELQAAEVEFYCLAGALDTALEKARGRRGARLRVGWVLVLVSPPFALRHKPRGWGVPPQPERPMPLLVVVVVVGKGGREGSSCLPPWEEGEGGAPPESRIGRGEW